MEGLNIHLCVHASLTAIHTSTEIWASLAFSYTLKHQQKHTVIPIGPMYGIFTYIYHENQPKVGTYSIHAAYIYISSELLFDFFLRY